MDWVVHRGTNCTLSIYLTHRMDSVLGLKKKPESNIVMFEK